MWVIRFVIICMIMGMIVAAGAVIFIIGIVIAYLLTDEKDW